MRTFHVLVAAFVAIAVTPPLYGDEPFSEGRRESIFVLAEPGEYSIPKGTIVRLSARSQAGATLDVESTGPVQLVRRSENIVAKPPGVGVDMLEAFDFLSTGPGEAVITLRAADPKVETQHPDEVYKLRIGLPPKPPVEGFETRLHFLEAHANTSPFPTFRVGDVVRLTLIASPGTKVDVVAPSSLKSVRRTHAGSGSSQPARYRLEVEFEAAQLTDGDAFDAVTVTLTPPVGGEAKKTDYRFRVDEPR